MTRVIGFVFLWCACALSLSAKGEEWGYDTVVAPVPRPAWIEKAIFLPCGAPWADAEKKTLNAPTQLLKDAGFTLMTMQPDGFCRLAEPEPGDGWPAACRAEVKASHAAGIRVIAGCYPTVGSRGPRDLLTAHPEWRRRTDDAVPLAPGSACLVNADFVKALSERLASRVREFDVDGFQFDAWYQYGFCRCPFCLENFKKDTGIDVPAKVDLTDLDYLKYNTWRDQKLAENFIKMRNAVKAAKPDAVLINWNNNDAVPSQMPECLNVLNDWTNKEWWDAADVSAHWLIKRLRTAAGDRPAGVQPYTFVRQRTDIKSGVYHGSSLAIEEVLYRMHKVMVMGSIPMIWPGARQGWNDEDTMTVARAYADFLPYIMETKTLKYVACLNPITSVQMARKPPMESRVRQYGLGAARAMLEAHVPFDVLSEHNMTAEMLAQYKVLVLPNASCLSDRLVDLVRQYVAGGGGLVATFETSLYDRWGKQRPDFAFADLFGASYGGTEPDGYDRIDFGTAPSHPITNDPAIRNLLPKNKRPGWGPTYYGRYAIAVPDGSAAAPLKGVNVDYEHEGDMIQKFWTPMLASERGAGRVVYFPAAIDAAYYNASYPYERMLIVNALRWAAKNPEPVRVTAPMCVSAGYFTREKAGMRQTMVHLLNEIHSTGDRGSKDDKEYASREELVPIVGVKVAFAGDKPTRVVLKPQGIDLEAQKTDRGWEVSVPELGWHAVVVAEYGK